MSEPTSQPRTLRSQSVRLSVRLNFILFPIDTIRLIEALGRKGFGILAKVPLPTQVPFRAHVDVGGTIARKGNSLVDMNPEKQVLGVAGQSVDEVLSVFTEVKDLIKSHLGVEIDGNSRFFEVLASYEFDSDQSAIENIGRVLSEGKITSGLENILGEAVSPFTIRLVLKGKVPNQEEWLDITVEPSILAPSRTYLISIVYRSAQIAKVLSFFTEMETKINKLIDLIEKS